MKGYSVPAGYMGYVPKFGRHILFETDGAYIEYMKEVDNEIQH